MNVHTEVLDLWRTAKSLQRFISFIQGKSFSNISPKDQFHTVSFLTFHKGSQGLNRSKSGFGERKDHIKELLKFLLGHLTMIKAFDDEF